MATQLSVMLYGLYLALGCLVVSGLSIFGDEVHRFRTYCNNSRIRSILYYMKGEIPLPHLTFELWTRDSARISSTPDGAGVVARIED